MYSGGPWDSGVVAVHSVTTARECQVYVVSRNAEVAGLIIIIPRLRGHTWCWRLVTLTAEMLGCCAAVRRCSARGVAVRCRAVDEPSRSYTVKAPTEALSKLRINKDTMLNGRLDIVSRHEIESAMIITN